MHQFYKKFLRITAELQNFGDQTSMDMFETDHEYQQALKTEVTNPTKPTSLFPTGIVTTILVTFAIPTTAYIGKTYLSDQLSQDNLKFCDAVLDKKIPIIAAGLTLANILTSLYIITDRPYAKLVFKEAVAQISARSNKAAIVFVSTTLATLAIPTAAYIGKTHLSDQLSKDAINFCSAVLNNTVPIITTGLELAASITAFYIGMPMNKDNLQK